MKAKRIGVPCSCQNGHNTTYWYYLSGMEWIPEGVKDEENCLCPKTEMEHGWRVREGYVQTVYLP